MKLTQVGDEFFPVTFQDLEILRKNHVLQTRIGRSSLSLLRRTLLKGVKIEVISGSSTILKLKEEFFRALSKDKIKFKDEKKDRFVVKILPNHQRTVDLHLDTLRGYLIRYGISLTKSFRENPDHTLMRVALFQDPDVNPILGFKTPSTKDLTEQSFILNLSPVARLNLTYSPVPPSEQDKGMVRVKLSFEDKSGGDNWNESFSRSFDSKSLDRSEIENFAIRLVSFNGLQ